MRSLAMTMLAAPLTVACMHSAPPVAASLPAIAMVGEVAGDATAGWLRDELAR